MNVEALKELAANVEAGEWDHSPGGVARKVFPYKSASIDDMGLTAVEAFNGSLDAAKALHDAVLPGLPAQITDQSPDYLGGNGWLVSVNWPHMEWHDTFTATGPFKYSARSDSPARAWLLAILRALIAQEESK